MNELERTIVTKLLQGDDPVLEVLRRQAADAHVSERDFTGVGFYATLSVPPHLPRLEGMPRLVIGDVYAEIDGLEHEAGFLLIVTNGAIDVLECFSIDDAFPQQPKLKRAYYVRPASGDTGSLVETQNRDLSWALRDRAA